MRWATAALAVCMSALGWLGLDASAAALPLSTGTVEGTDFPFPVCATADQLDCVESIRVFRGRDALATSLVEEVNEGTSRWSYVDSDGEVIPLQVFAGAHLPGALWINVDREPDAKHPLLTLDPVACRAGSVESCIQGFPPLPSEDRIQIAVRTSWLRYMGAGVQAHDMTFSRQDYLGGERFVISGKQNLLVIPASWDGPVDSWVPDHYEARLYVALDHAGNDASDSPYDPRCAAKGGPVRAANAPAGGQPLWRSDSQSLEFGVYAPHLGPDGSLYKGHFEAQFPVAWIRCQARAPRLNLSGFIVQVLSENGEEQAATTAIQVRKGNVKVMATNFHYSSPRVVMTKKPPKGG